MGRSILRLLCLLLNRSCAPPPHRLTPYKAAYDKQHPEEAGAPPLSASADEGQGERHGAREALKP